MMGYHMGGSSNKQSRATSRNVRPRSTGRIVHREAEDQRHRDEEYSICRSLEAQERREQASRLGYKVGDTVRYVCSSGKVSDGDCGTVVGFADDGRLQVRFAKLTYVCRLEELQKEVVERTAEPCAL